MGRPLNILQVVIGLNQGGIQQSVLSLLKCLNGDRFRAVVCAIEATGAIGRELESAGFEVITLNRVRQPMRTVAELVGLMRERQIDIVHAACYHPSLYARIAGIIAAVPILISHEHTIYKRRRWQRVVLNRILAPFTAGFIAVSRFVKKQLIDWYGYPEDKVEVIYNGVDTNRFSPPLSKRDAKRRLGLDPRRPVVGMLCRLAPTKGHRYLFDAIKALIARTDAQWLVVGAGTKIEEEEQVKKEARERGLTDVVKFLGMRRDLPGVLGAFDVYVLPTVQEGGPPISMLEAMAVALPVVVSDFPTNLEVVEHGHHGLVVPIGNSEDLARSIETLLRDSELRVRLGTEGRRLVERSFSLARYVERTVGYYDHRFVKAKGTPKAGEGAGPTDGKEGV